MCAFAGKSCCWHLRSEDKGFFSKWNWRSPRKHLATWMWLGQTILRWKMPIRQDFCRSPGTSRQTWYIPFPVSFLSSPLWLCQSSSPCCSVFPGSLICSSPSRLAAERETSSTLCQPAADVPGEALLSAEVLNKESFGPGAGGQAVSPPALRVTLPLLRRCDCTCQSSHYLEKKDERQLSVNRFNLNLYLFI